jgi:hypothetical protein
MKKIIFCIAAMLSGFACVKIHSFTAAPVTDPANFSLEYYTTGFGQNTDYMQPVFKVKGTKFVYTYEEMWGDPAQKKIRRDTLLLGNFRISSIDSISSLIGEIKDSLIHKTNIHSLGGSEEDIEILTGEKKIRFQLFNATDTTATKIIMILDAYMSGPEEVIKAMNYRE